MFGQRRASKLDDGPPELPQGLPSPLHLVRRFRNDVGMQVPVRQMAPYRVAQAVSLKDLAIESQRVTDAVERHNEVPGRLLDAPVDRRLRRRDALVDGRRHRFTELEEARCRPVVARQCDERVVLHAAPPEQIAQPLQGGRLLRRHFDLHDKKGRALWHANAGA